MFIIERDQDNIWKELVVIDEQGSLRWRPDIEEGVHDRDSRRFPARYIAMCDSLPKLEDHHPILDVSDLIQVAPNEFVTKKREIAIVDGLLRIVNKFPVVIPEPEDMILVGAKTPYSLLSVLRWASEREWNNCRMTLVDKSPIPIETLRIMIEAGYIDWSAGLDLVEENVLNYCPDKKPDIIIADILNTWMVPRYQYPDPGEGSPYRVYESFLHWAAKTIKPDGWFISRCLIFPTGYSNSSSSRTTQEKTERVMSQLGELANDLDRTAIESTVEEIFDNPRSMEGVKLTMAGPQAEKIFEEFYQKNFGTVHLIKVDNEQSGYRHLNFMCKA